MASVAQGQHLRAALDQDEAIKQHLSPEQLDHLLDPTHWMGSTKAMIDRVLEEYRASKGAV